MQLFFLMGVDKGVYIYRYIHTCIRAFPKLGVPQNGWFKGNPINLDDLGVANLPLYTYTNVSVHAKNTPMRSTQPIEKEFLEQRIDFTLDLQAACRFTEKTIHPNARCFSLLSSIILFFWCFCQFKGYFPCLHMFFSNSNSPSTRSSGR